MASSGIVAAQECIDRYGELQGPKKANIQKHKWIIYTMNSDKTAIIVEKVSSDGDYEAFLEEFPEEAPRFAVYDFEYDMGDAGKRNKPVFIHWNPKIDHAPLEQKKFKMIFAASMIDFRNRLPGIGGDFETGDLEEISYEAVLQKVAKR